MKKTILILLCAVIMASSMFVGCGRAYKSPSPNITVNDAAGIPKKSILHFNDDEGSAKLIKAFEDGNIPSEVSFMYDQMGSNPEITVKDPDTIKALYNALSKVTVGGKTFMSVTDCYHYIQFKLAEDEYVLYRFEGTDIWSYNKKNYNISNSKALFNMMYDLTKNIDWTADYYAGQNESETEKTGEDGLFCRISDDDFSIEYPAKWVAEAGHGEIFASPDGLDNPPYIRVVRLGKVDDVDKLIDEKIESFRSEYGERVPGVPERTSFSAEGTDLDGYVAKYSSVDGSCTISKHEYFKTVDGITYSFSCEYVSQAYGDMHEDENTYFEFAHAILSMS